MGRVSTNNTTWAIAEELTPGVLPASPVWRQLEPNDIPSFGAEIQTVEAEPISQFRQRRKGTVVGLESAAGIDHDLTVQAVQDLFPYWIYAQTKWARSQAPIRAGGTPYGLNLAAATGPNRFTHAAIGAALPEGTLVVARGFSVAANNGLKVVTSGSTTTSTPITTSLTAETPSAVSGARIEVAGVRAATGDLVLTVSGTTGTIESTALDFTTLGLQVGQFIHIGGLTSANWFGATNRGYARVTAIAANLLTFDKADSTLSSDDGTGDTVDLLFGSFLRNVAVTSGDFMEKTIQVESGLPNLGTGGAARYEYSIGNYGSTLSVNLPLTEKATFTIETVGLDTEVPTGTQKTNASTPVLPVATARFGTAKNLARLRLAQDVTGLSTCFTQVTLNIDNQVTAETCLGKLGADAINLGTLAVSVETEAILTDETVITAIRNNTTMTFDVLAVNEDGAVMFDIPSMTLTGGAKDFPRNEAVKISAGVQAFGDPTFGYSIGISGFAAAPQPA